MSTSRNPLALAPLGRRAALTGAAALAAGLAVAGPAAAHAEVEADTPQALAENVTLTFVSEAESASAGFEQLRIVLPKGLSPRDVTLDEAPKGWKLKPTDDGYTLGGPALKAGVNAEHSITVRQLPDAKQIAFKTVETYSDGKVSRWIELPSGDKEPEQPAPLLELNAAAPGAKPVTPSLSPTVSATLSKPSSAAPSTAAAAAGDVKAQDNDQHTSFDLAVGGVIAALIVIPAGVWWWARRRASSDS
ncbi:DUF1775 domain-containing protein [Streptomyces sp. NPDC056002]|uniref:DUF1775 domain-containing protein n=1 Tax=Streptomyces sp. NPDC056002 TaxID=3345675 RepID=UPI0035E013C3